MSTQPTITGSSTVEAPSIPLAGISIANLDEINARILAGGSFLAGSYQQVKTKDNPYSDAINKAGTRPSVPHAITFKTNPASKDKREVILPAGFYLLSAGTGGGKSITAAALMLTALTNGKDVTGQYHYMFEARTPAGSKFDISALTEGERDSYYDDWPNSKLKPVIGAPEAAPRLFILDSVALALRGYKMKKRAGMATMQQGMQPMDIEFVVVMEGIAVNANAVIIGVINDELVPFADKLEGMAEGTIIVHSAGRFSMRTRYDRTFHEYELQRSAVEAAATFLNYADYKPDDSVIFGVQS